MRAPKPNDKLDVKTILQLSAALSATPEELISHIEFHWKEIGELLHLLKAMVNKE